MVTKYHDWFAPKITVDKSLITFASGITFYTAYFWLALYFCYLWAAIKERSVQNLFSSCHWMSLLFRSINPSMKFRGCVQRLLRALITWELFVVQNIQSPITVACTNRTYRTVLVDISCRCVSLWRYSTLSIWWVKERQKANRFCRSIQISIMKSIDTSPNSPEPCNTSLMVTCSKVTNLLQQLCQPLHRVTYRTLPVMEAVMSTLGWVILCLREVFPCESYVYWTVHHLDSWIKRDQLYVTCFFISLFNAQLVSDVNTSILRSLRLICWVIS